ncbi:MAG: DUF4244 domain-containing protein [Actinomycetes bacterium]
MQTIECGEGRRGTRWGRRVWARVRHRLGECREAWSAERGQTTAEYALVILGAAALGTLLIAWATKSDAVGRLFDAVVTKILP